MRNIAKIANYECKNGTVYENVPFYEAELAEAYFEKNGPLCISENESCYFSEYEKDNIIAICTMNKRVEGVLRPQIKTNLISKDTKRPVGTEIKSDGTYKDVENVAILAVLMQTLYDGAGYNESIETALYRALFDIKLSFAVDKKEEKEKTVKALMSIQESINTFIAKEKIDLKDIMPTINIKNVNNGTLVPSKVIVGELKFFKEGVGIVEKKISREDAEKAYKICPERIFSEEEKKMIFDIPEHVKISENALSIAESIKRSWSRPEHLRKINILMEGPNGTGKTMDSKVIAALLGLPYTKQTCFADMDSSDVGEKMLPVAINSDVEAETEKVQLERKNPEGYHIYTKYESDFDFSIPSVDDFDFDPVGYIEEMTGIRLKDNEISEKFLQSTLENYFVKVRAYDARKNPEKYQTTNDILQAAEEDAKAYIFNASNKDDEDNAVKYVLVPSEIVKAFENGWVVEIQEPTCIADAAVLMALNAALEPGGVLNLPTRTVKRHPESIIIMTTNRSYEGCRPMNQSLRDRFSLAKKVGLPSEKEMVERLTKSTGCPKKTFVKQVVQITNTLNKNLEEIGINSQASLRGCESFIADVMDGADVMKSFDSNILYKITTDDEDLAEIRSVLEMNTSLTSLEY